MNHWNIKRDLARQTREQRRQTRIAARWLTVALLAAWAATLAVLLQEAAV